MKPSKDKRAKKQKTMHSLESQEEEAFTKDHLKDKPEALFQSLINPVETSEFFHVYWEKKPIVIKATEDKKSILSWFSKGKAVELSNRYNLQFLQDIHFCTCSDGKTKDLNKKGKVTLKEFTRLIDKMSATAQVHQVQRFVDSLWHVMERLESLFGCLVGSNVYITPPGSQGLAPHHDDVEVFIFQLEGEKHWRLYKPMVELAREYKRNLSSDEIGAPTHEFILRPGDILYMPRGTIHQADTPDDATSHSTHITISMYQRHSVGDFLQDVFPVLVENSFQSSLELRKGLPVGFFRKSSNSDIKGILINSLEVLTKTLKDSDSNFPGPVIEDFMRNRLPPYGFNPSVLEESPDGSQPTLNSKVHLTYPEHVSFTLASSESFIDDDDEEKEEELESVNEVMENEDYSLLVYSSIGNMRTSHMMNNKDNEDGSENEHFITLKFPSHFKPALEELLQASTSIEVNSLGKLSDKDSLHLVTSLWAAHLLTVE